MLKTVTSTSWAWYAVVILIMTNGCEFPYSPRPQPLPGRNPATKTDDTAAAGSGWLYPVNIGRQTCNPSISPGGAYPACMLWLGFDAVSINVPDSLKEYGTTAMREHDRLSIVDTANTLRWYIMISDVNSHYEFQCPEWSTHPDYITCLTGSVSQPYSGYAVRLSDKKSLNVCTKQLEEFSTPHLWVPDSVLHGATVDVPEYDVNGFIIKKQLGEFFGTTHVKFIYSLFRQGGTLYFVDFAISETPVPIPLRKPQGLESWYCQSPIISPDGEWVTYHCFSNAAQGAYYRSFIQKLAPDAVPVLIADKASDPHWWVDRNENNRHYIVYTVTRGDYYSEYDYSDLAIETSKAAGSTMIRRLKGDWRDAPSFLGTLAPDETYSPFTLVNLPFKGGLSPDGLFLCTAYKYAYLLRLK